MRGFLLRLLISALALWAAASLVPGVDIEGGWTLVFAAFWLGIVNALVRPLLVIFTLPLTLLTLGLFLFVVNAAMFGLTAALLEGFCGQAHSSGDVPAPLTSACPQARLVAIAPTSHCKFGDALKAGRLAGAILPSVASTALKGTGNDQR
jgi:putative membrane protein